MVRSGQVFFACCAVSGLLMLAGCAIPPPADGEGGALTVRRNPDGTVEITPDAASRDRQEWLERRRQDDQIQREIYNWLPRRPRGQTTQTG